MTDVGFAFRAFLKHYFLKLTSARRDVMINVLLRKFNLLLVIFNQSLHRSLDDASERHAFSLESLFELRTEIVGD